MSTSTGRPKGWPDNVRYMDRLEWAKECPQDWIRQCTVFSNTSDTNSASAAALSVIPTLRIETPIHGASKLVKISLVTDKSHPAFGQRCLLAASTLPPNSHIINYIGIVRPASTASQTSDYILGFVGDLSIDAEQAGNEARFFNDYRGIGERPNAEFRLFRDARTGAVMMGIWTGKDRIKKGTEILINYGKAFWKARQSSAAQDIDFEYEETE
eukprot:jgi/Hompol1/6655/HPOL_001217-RA